MNLEATTAKINYANFNIPQTLLAVGLNIGYRIYDLNFNLKTENLIGPIKIVEMLGMSNILGIVFDVSETDEKYTKVFLWDHKKNANIGEISTKPKAPKAIRLTRNSLFIVVEDKILHYDITQLIKVAEYDSANPHGLLAVSQGDQPTWAFPSSQVGEVTINLPQEKAKTHAAHTSAIQCIAISRDGSKVCTASEKGTVLRVFSTATGEKKEVRRGIHNATVSSLCFSEDNKFLCCASSTGKVHIFSLSDNITNTTSYFYYVGVTSEWSLTHIDLGDPNIIATFMPNSGNSGTADNLLPSNLNKNNYGYGGNQNNNGSNNNNSSLAMASSSDVYILKLFSVGKGNWYSVKVNVASKDTKTDLMGNLLSK